MVSAHAGKASEQHRLLTASGETQFLPPAAQQNLGMPSAFKGKADAQTADISQTVNGNLSGPCIAAAPIPIQPPLNPSSYNLHLMQCQSMQTGSHAHAQEQSQCASTHHMPLQAVSGAPHATQNAQLHTERNQAKQQLQFQPFCRQQQKSHEGPGSDGTSKLCRHGCGRPRRPKHRTCCAECTGPDGPHTRQCEGTNSSSESDSVSNSFGSASSPGHGSEQPPKTTIVSNDAKRPEHKEAEKLTFLHSFDMFRLCVSRM